MKGTTNAKDSLIRKETLYLQITGIENPTITVTYSNITNTYKGNNLEIEIPDGEIYTIKFNEISGYIIPESVTYTAIAFNSRTLKVEYVYDPVIDLSKQDIYGNPIAQTTANCYVIKEVGQYKFPLVFGNAIKNGAVNAAAYTNNGGSNSHDFVTGGYKIMSSEVITQPFVEGLGYKLQSLSVVNQDHAIVISNLSIQKEEILGTPASYACFSVSDIPPTGANFVIAFNGGDSESDGMEVVWTWHIWLWPYDLTPIEITNATGVSYNIMPVNLASKYDDDGIHIKNWFYQWGRPNPMLCSKTYNSTEDHASGIIVLRDKASSLGQALCNPCHFFYNNTSPYNWFGDINSLYYNLWDAACTSTGNSDNETVKTVYDPCPVGWKIPNGNTFTGLEYMSYSDGVTKLSRYSGDTTGISFHLLGERYYVSGGLIRGGSSCSIWLSSVRYYNNASIMNVGGEGFAANNNYSYAANGLSVRPVQE